MDFHERPSLADYAASFVSMPEAFVDHPGIPVHERWAYVMQHVPEARTRAVYEDFEDAFQRAYDRGNHAEIGGATELARLQYFFYKTMISNKFGRTHYNAYHVVNAEKWIMKLSDKFMNVKGAKFKEGHFLPTTHAPTTHPWLN